MNLVYIAHILTGDGTPEDQQANRERASRWCAWAARKGVSPVATWIVLSSQWPETPENRSLGIACDLAAIERCNELWVCGEIGDDDRSKGIQAERDHALKRGVSVSLILTHDGEPPV